LPWLEKNKEEKFFIWIHYSDPHDPYAPPTLPPDFEIELNGEPVKQLCLQKYERISLTFKLRPGTNKITFSILNPYPGAEDQMRAALNEIEFILNPESMKLDFTDIQFVHREDKRSALIKNSGTLHIDCPGQEGELTIKARGNINLHPEEKIRYYREEVEYMDNQIATLTKKLHEWDLLAKCLVVMVGDHGEGLGEDKTKFGDRYFGHIHYLYGEHMKVPLIFYDPTMRMDQDRIEGMTTIMDVTPTILGRMGWPRKKYHRGRDLYKTNQALSSIFEETYSPEAIHDRFGILQYPWHLIYTPETGRMELYDVNADPDEQNDVFEKNKNVAEIRDLHERLKIKATGILERKKEIKIDQKSIEMLKSLGYIK
jgi:hypothetical protein